MLPKIKLCTIVHFLLFPLYIHVRIKSFKESNMLFMNFQYTEFLKLQTRNSRPWENHGNGYLLSSNLQKLATQ